MGRSRAVVAMWSMVFLGLGLRLVQFLREPAVWHDEAALIINVLGKTYHEMLGVLFHAEAAPPLFMMIERAIVQILGDDGVQALRLFPFLASCLSLVLFAGFSRQILTPWSAVWAVALFATSDRLLWHCCEAKPYALDTLVGVMLAIGFHRAQTGSFALWTFGMAALAPALLWLVFPACFMYGGVILALMPKLWRQGRTLDYVAWFTLGVMVLAGFAALYFGPIKAQRCDAMDSCWTRLFPDWSRPWSVPLWSLASTLEVVRYILKPTGNFLIGVLAVGAVSLWRSPHRALLASFVIPLGLVYVASCLHSYPYGAARIIVFAAPGIILMIGAGIEPVWRWLAGYHRWAPALLIVPLLVPIGQGVYRTVVPWDRADTDAAANYVIERIQPGEQVTFNTWEYEYYFRDLSVPPHYCINGVFPDADRVWLVFSSSYVDERMEWIAHFTRGWKQVDRKDFVFSTAVLLERTTQPDDF